ncbi:hypothetical protein FS749_005436 [Ceratobasidium sp. UAMH 11750]|nr:hypothetical protein FS749_005436 [Ceratobasidium sp. UAMH 11750]
MDPRSMERCLRWTNSAAAANQLHGQPDCSNIGLAHDAEAGVKWILDMESVRGKFWPAPVLDLPEAATPGANVSGLDRSCFVGPSYLEEQTFSASAWMFGPGESTTTQRAPYRPSIVPHNPDSPELHTTTQDTMYMDARAEAPLPFDSPHGSVPRPPQVSRLDLLQAWRMRMGLASSAPGSSASRAMACTRPCGAKGGLLPLSILERIVRDLLDMAAPNTHPRRVLAPLAMASKRLRSIAAPFIYEHVEIRNKEDREIYAHAGATKYVRRLTIYFDPHDRCNPRGALMDKGLCSPYFATQGGSEGGIARHFPQCYEVRLVAECVSEELPPAQRVDLVSTLSYRIPTTASRVVLETDLADLSAEFAFHILMREGFVNPNVEIEIRTNRDEVVRSVERIIQSRVSRWTHPVLLQKRIILRGPTYGTDIIWDESMGETRMIRRMWQVTPTKPTGHPNQAECRAQSTQEDEDEVLGVQEAMAEISRRNASSAKKTLATTTQSPPRKPLHQKGKKSSKALHVSSGRSKIPPPKHKPLASTVQDPPFPSEGDPSGYTTDRTTLIGDPNEATSEHVPRTRQTPARHAGKLAAEEPSTIEKMVEELEKEDQAHQDSCTCCRGRAPTVVGVQNPIAKAELNVFVGTYYARLYAARCRMAKFARMRKLQQKKNAKSGSSKQGIPGIDRDVAQGAAKGPARKRARRA